MGVDASAIGGVGCLNPISQSFDFYHGLGLVQSEMEDEFDGVDAVVKLVTEVCGDDVSFQYTYGYEEPELYAFVPGENIDEVFANVDPYIEALKKIGFVVERKDIKDFVISFFS